MLAAALRRYIGHGAFDDLEQSLLDSLAADISGDGRILRLSRDLIDLIHIDDAVLRPLDIPVGRLDQLEQNVLHILAYIAGFCQCSRVGDGERNIQDLRQRLSQEGLA